ncbi:hypothetical protein P775_08490 [Puniceibacterium antarcticum]|uniref:Lipoprotein n=1 Tax=Puniceibacterium antarcticum TaxID=1206336 RepID=A0A2G8RG64_9RHOB|nr:hypothetical protein [Puniceibacterium antarcticum]PIL20557.1 hypothetical protein P775_08490 [Puniceibacterium antarcticum]
MRLTAFLTLICAMFLTAGCDKKQPIELATKLDPLFCDVEEPRRFTRAELDARAASWPENLRLDIKTNTTWDRECVPSQGD